MKFEEFKKKRIIDLSEGEKIRLKLCAALINKPKFIILDLSSQSLEMRTKEELFFYLRKIKRNRVILISSNEISDIETLNDRLLFIKDNGKIISNMN